MKVAKAANAKRFVLYHHEPLHDDKALAALERDARKEFPASDAAYEGMTIEL